MYVVAPVAVTVVLGVPPMEALNDLLAGTVMSIPLTLKTPVFVSSVL